MPAFSSCELVVCCEKHCVISAALLSAATTWLVIKAGRDVANGGDGLVSDLIWILIVQCAAYAACAVSWVYAERAGMRAFGLYIAQFVRDNRHHPMLLGDRHAREQVEPFLTGETFHTTIYRLMCEVEGELKILLALIFNSIVLGVEIDVLLPLAYATVFTTLIAGSTWDSLVLNRMRVWLQFSMSNSSFPLGSLCNGFPDPRLNFPIKEWVV